jgi:S1-C subfamily serine protease
MFGGFCMNRRSALQFLGLALGLACIPALARPAKEKGWFGFAVSVDVEGFSLNPTLRTAKIETVVPSSPADIGGLLAGDLIVEAQGVTVAGAKAEALKVAVQRAVGETLQLTIKRGSSAPRVVVLTAIAKPVGV